MGFHVVYTRRSNLDAASAFAEELRDAGHGARITDTRHYDGEVEGRADAVYHDDNPAVVSAYEDADVPCESWVGDAHEPEVALPDGYHIEQAGSWYKLIGPDGEQVGKSQRSPEDAQALLGD